MDLEAARQRRIPVCNVPDFCIDEVADHTLAFILAATRHVVANCTGVRQGRWKLAVPLDRMRSLSELTVGIVGFGRIGRAVAARLVRLSAACWCTTPCWMRRQSRRPGRMTPVGRAACGERRYYAALSGHAPDTRMIDATAIAKMKSGVILVNLARCAGRFAGPRGRVAERPHRRRGPRRVRPGAGSARQPAVNMDNVILAAHRLGQPRAVKRLRETVADIAKARCVRGETCRTS